MEYSKSQMIIEILRFSEYRPDLFLHEFKTSYGLVRITDKMLNKINIGKPYWRKKAARLYEDTMRILITKAN